MGGGHRPADRGIGAEQYSKGSGPVANIRWSLAACRTERAAVRAEHIRQKTTLDAVKCVVYTTHVAQSFGRYVRRCREALREQDRAYSVRQVAQRIGVEPSYLSRVERDEEAPPSEDTIVRLARDLGEDPDVLLAMAGKLSSDLKRIILARPELFSALIRELKDLPDRAVRGVVREVRDGRW